MPPLVRVWYPGLDAEVHLWGVMAGAHWGAGVSRKEGMVESHHLAAARQLQPPLLLAEALMWLKAGPDPSPTLPNQLNFSIQLQLAHANCAWQDNSKCSYDLCTQMQA